MEGINLVKIGFELEQDEEGYPPDKWETLWAQTEEQEGLYRIDNIPFYVRGISSGDVVAAEYSDDQLYFARLVTPSSNSVFRLYVAEVTDMQSTRDAFRALNCESELSRIPKLVAIEIPGSVAIEPVSALLENGALSGRWEYEWGVLRHTEAA